MVTTVLVSGSQTVLAQFQDTVTNFYKVTSGYKCQSFQFSLTSQPITSGNLTVASLSTAISIDSFTGMITFNPTLATQVGSHTIQVSVSLPSYSSVTALVITFTAVVNPCVITSYQMSLSPLTILYTLTNPGPQPTVYLNQNAQTPLCGYQQQYSYSLNTSLAILSNNIVQFGSATFTISGSSDRTLVNYYGMTLTSSTASDYTYTAQSTQTSIIIIILDACKDSALKKQSVLDVIIYTYNWSLAQSQISPLYTPVDLFTDTVSEAQSATPNYCGDKTYTSSIFSSTATAQVQVTIVTSSQPELSIVSNNFNQMGTYVIFISGSLDCFPNNTLSVQFTLIVLDSCYITQIQVPSYIQMSTTVLAPDVSQVSPSIPTDTVSSQFGNGTNICGQRTFTISSNNSQFNTQGLSIDSSTGTIVLNPISSNQVSNITIIVTVTLNNYQNISNSTNYIGYIFPCMILGVSMQQPSNQVYTLSYSTLQFNYNQTQVTQNRACGYHQSFSYAITPAPQVDALNLTNSSNGSFVYFSLQSTNRTLTSSVLGNKTVYNDQDYTITLTVWLTNCTNQQCNNTLPGTSFVGGNPFMSTSFKLTILDPCKRTTVSKISIENFHSFSGYVVQSKVPYNFIDSVSTTYGILSYCGALNLTCNFTISNITMPFMNVTNNAYFTFGPPAYYTNFATQNLTLTAYIVDYYPQIMVNQTFNITTLGISPPSFPFVTYYLNSSAIASTYENFEILPENYTASDLDQNFIQFYLAPSPNTQLSIPLNIITRGLEEFNTTQCINWMTLNTQNNMYQVSTGSNEYINDYMFVVVQTFPKLEQLVYGTFIVSIQELKAATVVTPPPLFSPPLQDQSVECSPDKSFNWTYQLPNAVSPVPGVTVSQITGICTSDSVLYIQSTKNLQQDKYVGQAMKTVCNFVVADSKKNYKKYSLTIAFTCTQNKTVNISTSSFLKQKIQLPNQTSYPSAVISNIDKSGLMTIQFNVTMKVPQSPGNIQNGAIQINGTNFPILNLSVIPGKYSNLSHLAFNWTYVEMNPSQLKLQLTFDEPNYVSSQQANDKIQVIIYGNYLFADIYANYIQAGTVLSKSLPKQTKKSVADKMQALGLDTQNGMVSILFTNTVMTVLVAGPIQYILGAVKQLQITSHLMLISVQTPGNLNIFFSLLLQIVTLNIISTTDFVNTNLKLDKINPLNDQFNELGFSSLYVLQNLGTLAFIMIGVPVVMLIVLLLIKVSRAESLDRYKLKISNYLFYNGTISFLFETILLIAICGMLNYYYFLWNSYGNVTNSAICVVFLFICAVVPPFVGVFYNLPDVYRLIQSKNKEFMERFGDILAGLNFLRNGRQVILYLVFTTSRKVLLAATCVFLTQSPLFSIFSQVMISQAMIVMLGYVEPYSDKVANQMEILNECFVLIHLYHMLCFTNFQPNLNWRDVTGFSLISATSLNIFVNLAVVCLMTLAVTARRLKIAHLKHKQRVKLESILQAKKEEQRKKLEAFHKRQEDLKNQLEKQMWDKKLAKQQELIKKQQLEQRAQAEKVTQQKLAAQTARAAQAKLRKQLAKEEAQHQQFVAKQKELIRKEAALKSQQQLQTNITTAKSDQQAHQNQSIGQKQAYDFKENQVAQLNFVPPAAQLVSRKPAPIVESPLPAYFPEDTIRKARQKFEKANPELARQLAIDKEASIGWSKYEPGQYAFLEQTKVQITDPRFLGPAIPQPKSLTEKMDDFLNSKMRPRDK